MRPREQLACERVADWGNVLATTLQAIAPHLERLAGDLQRVWPDDRGRECTERLGLLRCELDRQVGASERLARAASRLAHDLVCAAEVGTVGFSSGVSRRHGPRLGGTESDRVEDGRGMRISQLPDPGLPSG